MIKEQLRADFTDFQYIATFLQERLPKSHRQSWCKAINNYSVIELARPLVFSFCKPLWLA